MANTGLQFSFDQTKLLQTGLNAQKNIFNRLHRSSYQQRQVPTISNKLQKKANVIHFTTDLLITELKL